MSAEALFKCSLDALNNSKYLYTSDEQISENKQSFVSLDSSFLSQEAGAEVPSR